MTTDQFRARIRRHTNTTVNDYSDADLIADLNGELSSIQIDILRDRGVLEFDDTNFSDLPIATVPVTAGVDTYKIVNDETGNKVITIHKVAYLKDGKYVDVPRVRPAEGSQADLVSSGTGYPRAYYEVGNSIVLVATPGVSFTMKVWFDREMSFLTTSDTTKVPGVPSAYHPLAALRSSLRYDNLSDTRYARITAEIAREEMRLQQYEQNRREDEQTVMGVEVISDQ